MFRAGRLAWLARCPLPNALRLTAPHTPPLRRSLSCSQPCGSLQDLESFDPQLAHQLRTHVLGADLTRGGAEAMGLTFDGLKPGGGA